MPLARRTASKDNMPAKASDPPFAQDLKLKNRHRSVAPEKTEATRPPPDSEIIVIDDSDDENPPLKRKRALSRTNSKGRAKSSLEDVVEITSGPDDHSSRSHEKTIKNLQEQVQSLRQANTRLQNRLAYGREESGSKDAKIAQLTADIASMKKTSNNVLPELEDSVSCDICVLKMWSPYTLPGCGHTFCQSCLDDWFTSTLAKHIQDHPNYHAEVRFPPRILALAEHDPRVRAQIEAHRGPQPSYTCPACRAPVKSKPVEAFALKKVVMTVAKASGESSPQRRGAHAREPWEGFFP